MIYFSTLLISLFITISLMPLAMRVAVRSKALDMPDERKVHTEPVPRIGGIVMAVGVFVSMLLWRTDDVFLKAFAAGAAIIVVFGIFDDLKGLNYKVKFLAQVAAALTVIFYGEVRIIRLGTLLPENALLPLWVAIPLTLVVVVGVTNAVNLADGLDGLAGGICLISFCCIGWLAYQGDNVVVTFISISLIGVIFGFLRFNTYPARLFMGDTGSQLLGFSLVTCSIALTQSASSALSPVLPLIICGFPILDTVTVMSERIAAGRSPFVADKNHFHHRLIRLGFFHTEAVFVIYVIQSILVLAAFFFRFYSDWALLIGYGIFSNLIITSFFLGDRTGYKFKRYPIVDRVIKGRLKFFRDKGILIKLFFRIVEIGVPILFIATAFLPKEIPPYLAIISAVLICCILVTMFVGKKLMKLVVTATLYLTIPLMVYLSSVGTRSFGGAAAIYNFALVFLVVCVVLTLKFTRRRKGFKVTPMDFLILFVAVVAPYIAGTYKEYKEFGIMAVKTIMFYFSYEVLIGELRGDTDKLAFLTICALLVNCARGLLGG